MVKTANRLLPLVALAIALLIWEGMTKWSEIPLFILPPPSAISERLTRALMDGSLLRHTLVTLSEVLVGLALGAVSASLLGYGLAKSSTLERVLSPYIVASQAVPIVAIAPLLVIWLGPGQISKVLIAALIVFFPVLINTIVGFRTVPSDLYDLMRSLRAKKVQIFWKLEVPAAMPVLLGGLKIGATLAVIGAVVGEFVGANEGLGFLINLGGGLYDTPLVFAAVFTLIAMALALYGIVAALERKLLAWRTVEAS
ncbi:MAG: ABC transporter permease [Anaerolineales bacterium]